MIYPYLAGEINCSFRGASVRHGDGPSFASLFRAGQVTTCHNYLEDITGYVRTSVGSIQRFLTQIKVVIWTFLDEGVLPFYIFLHILGGSLLYWSQDRFGL